MACIGWIRRLLVTGLMLLFLAGASEIGLRVSALWNPGNTPQEITEDQLLAPCWQARYQLKPLTTAQTVNPDTQAVVTVRTNEWGLRGGPCDVPKPARTFRILNLGDETTLALLTAEQETFSAVLQQVMQPQMRDHLEVINAGIPGYCPLLAYLKLKHTLLTLQPDLVIFHFDMNDISDDYRARRQLVLDNQGIAQICPHPDLISARQPQQQFCEQLMLIKRGTQLWAQNASLAEQTGGKAGIGSPGGELGWILDSPPDWGTYINHALEPLVLMNELVESSQALFVVSCLPDPWQVSADACNQGEIRQRAGLQSNRLYSSKYPFQTVAAFCQKHQIRQFSVVDELRTQPQPAGLFLQHEAEYSSRGHAIYARLLAQHLYQMYTPTRSQAAPVSRHTH